MNSSLKFTITIKIEVLLSNFDVYQNYPRRLFIIEISRLHYRPIESKSSEMGHKNLYF